MYKSSPSQVSFTKQYLVGQLAEAKDFCSRPRPRPRTWPSRPRPKPRTQNVSSRTPQGQGPRPRTTTLVAAFTTAQLWVWLGHCKRLVGISLPPNKGAEYYDQRVCMSKCMSARISLNHMSKRHQIFYAYYLWPWLGPVLAVMRYVMYFRFFGWRHACI